MKILVLGLLFVVASCGTAQLEISKELKNSSKRYKVSEKPGLFSGDKLVFSPFKASKIDRSFVGDSTASIGSFKASDKEQKFTYKFKGIGKIQWSAKCKVTKETYSLGSLSTANGWKMKCTFKSEGKSWKFKYTTHPDKIDEQKVTIGSKTYDIEASNKLKGVSFESSEIIGYKFLDGAKPVAAVSSLNGAGPVWFNQSLSKDTQDSLGAVMVAFMLNQVK